MISFHCTDGLETHGPNEIFTNQQGGRYKTFGLTVGLVDQFGSPVSPVELMELLGGQLRIPLHVSLYYSAEKDGPAQLVESKIAVGGTLKGEPLIEVKDSNGMLVSADSITPQLNVESFTRLCIRINDVSKSHMNRRFCVRLSTVPELPIQAAFSQPILVRSKLVPSKKRSKPESAFGGNFGLVPDFSAPKAKRGAGRGQGQGVADCSWEGVGASSGSDQRSLSIDMSPMPASNEAMAGQVEALQNEVAYLRSVLHDIQKHILTPAGITAYPPAIDSPSNGPHSGGSGSGSGSCSSMSGSGVGWRGTSVSGSSMVSGAASGSGSVEGGRSAVPQQTRTTTQQQQVQQQSSVPRDTAYGQAYITGGVGTLAPRSSLVSSAGGASSTGTRNAQRLQAQLQEDAALVQMIRSGSNVPGPPARVRGSSASAVAMPASSVVALPVKTQPPVSSPSPKSGSDGASGTGGGATIDAGGNSESSMSQQRVASDEEEQEASED